MNQKPNESAPDRDAGRPTESGAKPAAPGDAKGMGIAVRDTSRDEPPKHRAFPGPLDTESPLRVAMRPEAFADLTLHAREALDAEVGGVLVGDVCEDDRGVFVWVEAVVAGMETRQGATHVTFTHETWKRIHDRLERDHPGKRIVGWYHSHPGFGVEFSDMDRFVHRNFFPAAYQVALVVDPLGGDLAAFRQQNDRAEYLPRIWVDGREVRCRLPGRSGGESTGAAGDAAGTMPPNVLELLERTETRLQQVLQAVEAQHQALGRFLFTVGAVLCFGILAFFGYSIWTVYTHKYEPPKLQSMVPVPVQIGDKTVLLGVSVVQWTIPEDLDLTKRLEKEIRQKLEIELQKALEDSGALQAIEQKAREKKTGSAS